MIDWKKSAERNRMSVEELKAWFERYPKSGKTVWKTCDGGCKIGDGWVYYNNYSDLCKLCAMKSEKTREKISKAQQKRFENLQEREKARKGTIKHFKEHPEAAKEHSEKLIEYYKDTENIEKNRNAQLKYHRDHPEAREEQSKRVLKYYKTHPEVLVEMSKSAIEYYKTHPEVLVEMSKSAIEYYKNNPEAREEASRKSTIQWSDRNNRDEMSRIKIEYHKNNPEAKDEQRKKLIEYWSNQENRIQMSCTKLGITREEWDGFSKSYCDQWTEELREYIREKYNRKCFICDMTEEDNGRKLDVHHVDYNKRCGCDGTECRLVPLCHGHHSCTTSGDREMWEKLIMDMIENLEETLIENSTSRLPGSTPGMYMPIEGYNIKGGEKND